MTNFIGEAPRFRLAVAHGAAEEEAKAMMERLKAAFPQAEEIYFGTISPALVVHTGPGLLGVGIQLLMIINEKSLKFLRDFSFKISFHRNIILLENNENYIENFTNVLQFVYKGIFVKKQ